MIPVSASQSAGAPAARSAAAAVQAAIAVFAPDGRLSSRNSVDRTLFGNGASAAELSGRFEDSAGVETFLARLRETGTASGILACRTDKETRPMQVGAVLLPGGPAEAASQGPPAGAVLTFAPPEPAPPEPAPPPGAGDPGIAPDRLARLGHELRSPLNAVLGFAELIRQGAGDGAGSLPARTAGHAADIVSAAWRLLGLADDLVAMGETRGGAQFLRMGEADLGRIARRLIRLAAPAANAAGVRIDDRGLPPPGAVPVVLGDEGALWSVVDNLLQNAIRHAGSDVTVRLADPGPAGGLCLEIADDGPGLAPEALAQALEPGGRPGMRIATPGRPGGLGLPIARDLIEAHDGTLEIQTAPGEGFRARLRLPASRVLEL